MSPKEKGKFEDMAKQDKVRYEKEMKTYIPPMGQKKKRFKDPNAPKRPPYVPYPTCSTLIIFVDYSVLNTDIYFLPTQVCILPILCRLSPQGKR